MGIFSKKNEQTVRVEIREVESVREVIREVPVASEKLILYQVTGSPYAFLSPYLKCLGSYWRSCEEAFAAIALEESGSSLLTVARVEAVRIAGEYYLTAGSISLGLKADPKNKRKKGDK